MEHNSTSIKHLMKILELQPRPYLKFFIFTAYIENYAIPTTTKSLTTTSTAHEYQPSSPKIGLLYM